MRACEFALKFLARVVHDGAWDAIGSIILGEDEARGGVVMWTVFLHRRAQNLVTAGHGQAKHAGEVR